jgi:hypothetical protein
MSADIFVYLDVVQFSKNGVQNRNQINTRHGPLWLTIPVKHQFGQAISETLIADRQVLQKHWKTLQANYAKTAGFQRWHHQLETLLGAKFELLVDASIASTEWMLQMLQVNNQRIKASELDGIAGEASQLIASICKTLNASTYLTGTGALAYLNPDDFHKVGCEIMVQRWNKFVYKQSNTERGFESDLSALDLLLNCPDEARQLISAAGAWARLEAP